MEAPGDAKPDWWIVSRLAKKMGYSGFDWKDEQAIYDEVIAKTKGSSTSDISEISWSDLIKAGTSGVQFPKKDRRSISRLYSPEFEKAMGGRFATKDGKAHLEPVIALADLDPYNHPLRDKISSEYPLWMVMHRSNENWNSGYNFYSNGMNVPLTPNLYERIFEQPVSINPKNAKVMGIKTGDWVSVNSRNGSFKGVAKVEDVCAPGVIDVISLYPKGESTPNMATSEKADPKLAEWDRMVPVNITKG